ncbi:hypothetical protein SynMVIR181_00218 [Synechococcus sp. MVIR-18-1]|nr:hypothetical protein SynMVIR181_00218 [Synechococcus sp. MVIR-18-1]
MWRLPNQFNDFFFGNGIFVPANEFDHYGDPGYLCYFIYFGIVGCLLHHGLFLWMGYTTIKKIQPIKLKLAILIIYILMFVTESKEPFFNKANVILFIMFFLSVWTSSNQKHHRFSPELSEYFW